MNKYLIIAVLIIVVSGFLIFNAKSKSNNTLELSQENVTQKMIPSTTATQQNSSQAETGCTSVDTSVPSFMLCPGTTIYKKLSFNDKNIIENVDYAYMSPNKKWIFVIGPSDEFAKSLGAPEEYALYMVNVQEAAVTQLFSQIYAVSFMPTQGWDSNGDYVTFTAGNPSTPDILANSKPFSVLYCNKTCKVLANNAGSLGISGKPSYFEDGVIKYVDTDGLTLSVKY